MAQYNGITPDSLFLMAENRFQDSKAFYEVNKPAIWHGVVEPLKALVADMMPAMLAFDPMIGGTVSRVRRDNRYTKDKSMYRENMWIVFMRDKRAWDWCVPAFYIDFSLKGAEWGMGFYGVTPALMKALRGIAARDPQRVIKAIRRAKRAGFAVYGEPYARPRSTADTPAELRPLYDCKNIGMSRQEPLDFVSGSDLPDKLLKGYTALAPLYAVFVEAMEENAGLRSDTHAQ